MHTDVIAYQTVRVTIQSLNPIEDELDREDCSSIVGDNGTQSENMFSELSVASLLKTLTRRQLSVTERIIKGYSRREIAEQDNISVQAMHQIVLRIRRRIQTCISRKLV